MLNKEFQIAGRWVGSDHSPYVIAEVGSNFNQSLDLAYRLIDAAGSAGADAVKFQLFRADVLYPQGGKMHDLFKSIELDPTWIPELVKHASDKNLHFFASAFDKTSVRVLIDASVPALKMASSETTNLALLFQMAAPQLPLLISTGMCEMVDVEEAVAICVAAGNANVALLQCGAVYPLPITAANLRVMSTYEGRYGCPVGFSDHTLGTFAASVAVGAGASVLEKHLTLDRTMDGPDHFYAVEPSELKAYVAAAREAHSMLGERTRSLLPEERLQGRRDGLHAARDLEADHVLRIDDLEIRRPATGIRDRHLSAVLGATTRNPIAKGAPLTWDNVGIDRVTNGR